ncbi:hypothetical protein NT2_15_00150 [Caenibius tardaugens NBRC 16725]|jgi:hypothetical protein|uniref:Phosphoadenosine phosphosulphate reductase domain-containing protein n=1 Tax=Caenibius tardaugens NBRC 16725 TaxID=1219035 RepID=U3A8H2_9SPHN|nr:hypothetical protein [Caenibius tardaugens]AZI35875.1 hypothetical protein EGO55_07730 [Caenibius tardaugens NBRC 16725]GAD51058.1 hypothetical protein NT2_15_00150 [Caenibius tardaugens NBRC 16725]
MNALAFPGFVPDPGLAADIQLRVLSLGAGVQSTTLALMAAHGEIGPMPDCAIFADTGWEPKAVYEHLAWLRSPNVLPFPVHIVSSGDLRADLIAASRGERWASIPAFTRTVTPAGSELPVYDEDENGDLVPVGSRVLRTERIGVGMIRRQCTSSYKIVPIRRKVRELLGIAGRRSPGSPVAEQWIGISLDEALRMKPSFEDWQFNRWPLIERGMTRQDCLRWLVRHDYPIPPKSACIGCPFHSDTAWRTLRDHDPEAWDNAVSLDAMIRTGLRGIRGEVYLHRSAVPLDEADLTTAADHGQLDLWQNECEGMCGI